MRLRTAVLLVVANAAVTGAIVAAFVYAARLGWRVVIVPPPRTVQYAPPVAPVPPRIDRASTCTARREAMLSMSDENLYDQAVAKKMGNCYVAVATPTCPSCACPAYVKVKGSTWPGEGWPINPHSRASTGCVSQTQYPGYTSEMASSSMQSNAVAQLRDALYDPIDVCGLCDSDRKLSADDVLGPPSPQPRPARPVGHEPRLLDP